MTETETEIGVLKRQRLHLSENLIPHELRHQVPPRQILTSQMPPVFLLVLPAIFHRLRLDRILEDSLLPRLQDLQIITIVRLRGTFLVSETVITVIILVIGTFILVHHRTTIVQKRTENDGMIGKGNESDSNASREIGRENVIESVMRHHLHRHQERTMTGIDDLHPLQLATTDLLLLLRLTMIVGILQHHLLHPEIILTMTEVVVAEIGLLHRQRQDLQVMNENVTLPLRRLGIETTEIVIGEDYRHHLHHLHRFLRMLLLQPDHHHVLMIVVLRNTHHHRLLTLLLNVTVIRPFPHHRQLRQFHAYEHEVRV